MRIEKNQDGKTHKVWLNSQDFKDLRNAAKGYREDLIIRLGGKAGLRSFEIPQIKPKHMMLASNGEDYFLRIPKGKDTKNGEGKPRDTYLPKDIHRDLHIYVNENHIGKNQKIFNITPRRIQQIISETGECATINTENEGFKKISSHDLRRYFGHSMLVEKRMNPEVVIEIGGWEDYQAIKPYLSKPSEETIIEEFSRIQE